MAKRKKLTDYMHIGDISADIVLGNMPFVLFLCFLGLVYIANAHYSMNKIRQIQASEQELKEMRWQYMSLKSEVMYNSKQSEIAKDVDALGLKNVNSPIYRIEINE